MPAHDEVNKRVESVCGVVDEMTPLQTWGTSVVARCRAGDRLVVYKSGGTGSIAGEAAALRLAAAAGVAVPEVLQLVEDDSIAGGGWMVMTALPGSPWQLDEQLWKTDEPASAVSASVLDGVANAFVGLHQITGEGAGSLRADGRGVAGNWAAWLAHEAARHCPGLLRAGALDSSEVAQVTDFFGRRRHWFATRPIVLLHGDLGEGEIIVDGDRVSGIVDFGTAAWGDPIYDFAHFVGGGPADDPRPAALLPPVLERYWRVVPREPDWDRFFAAYRAFNHLRNLSWSVREGLDEWIPGLRADLLVQLRRAGG